MNEEGAELEFNPNNGDFTLQVDDSENVELGLGEDEPVVLSVEDDNSTIDVEIEGNEDRTFDVGFGEVTSNDTNNFNELYNRPSYNGQIMTNETNIPEVIHYEAGNSISIRNGVISATNDVEVDTRISSSSTNPVENRVIFSALATKPNSSELAEVAFSGYYDDLKNEPTNFTHDEWNLLWRNQ